MPQPGVLGPVPQLTTPRYNQFAPCSLNTVWARWSLQVWRGLVGVVRSIIGIGGDGLFCGKRLTKMRRPMEVRKGNARREREGNS